MDAIQGLGCCVCARLGFSGTPGEVHHLIGLSGHRIGHLATICLCSPGHHRNGDGKLKISRHPTRARFEDAYGTEAELLEWSKKAVRNFSNHNRSGNHDRQRR